MTNVKTERLHLNHLPEITGLSMEEMMSLSTRGLFPKPTPFPMTWTREAIEIWALGRRAGLEEASKKE